MARLSTPAPGDLATGTQSVLDAVGKQFGFVPNMFAMVASNPTAVPARSGSSTDPKRAAVAGFAMSRFELDQLFSFL